MFCQGVTILDTRSSGLFGSGVAMGDIGVGCGLMGEKLRENKNCKL